MEARISTKLGESFIVGTDVTGIEATATGGKIVGAIAGVKELQYGIEIVHGPRGL